MSNLTPNLPLPILNTKILHNPLTERLNFLCNWYMIMIIKFYAQNTLCIWLMIHDMYDACHMKHDAYEAFWIGQQYLFSVKPFLDEYDSKGYQTSFFMCVPASWIQLRAKYGLFTRYKRHVELNRRQYIKHQRMGKQVHLLQLPVTWFFTVTVEKIF